MSTFLVRVSDWPASANDLARHCFWTDQEYDNLDKALHRAVELADSYARHPVRVVRDSYLGPVVAEFRHGRANVRRHETVPPSDQERARDQEPPLQNLAESTQQVGTESTNVYNTVMAWVQRVRG